MNACTHTHTRQVQEVGEARRTETQSGLRCALATARSCWVITKGSVEGLSTLLPPGRVKDVIPSSCIAGELSSKASHEQEE
jgi:hypothetical protein